MQYNGNEIYFSLYFGSIEKEVFSLKRNKATGYDELRPGILRGTVIYMSKQLCRIVKFSSNTSNVSNIQESTKFTAIFKSENSDFPENSKIGVANSVKTIGESSTSTTF